MLICNICNKQCKNLLSLSIHLSKTHPDVSKKDYYDKHFKQPGEGKCSVCGKETQFIDFRSNYSKYCVGCDQERNRNKNLICEICGQSLNNYQAVHTHIRKHKISDKDYYDSYLKRKGDGVCPVCGKATEFLGIRGYKKHCNEHKYSGLLSPNAKVQYKNTCLDKYGVESSNQSALVQSKMKQSMTERYGVEHAFQSKELRNKYTQTMLDRFGVATPMESDALKKKFVQNNIEKYGVVNPQQVEAIHKKTLKHYLYNDEFFDSSWELALYIFCVDGNIPILREPVRFEYRDKNNKKHYYYPDFQVGEDLIEIKGDQFFDTSGVFINPRTKLPDSEKYACMMVNNVQIVRYADCEPFITYCVNKYNDKHWYKQFVYRKDK